MPGKIGAMGGGQIELGADQDRAGQIGAGEIAARKVGIFQIGAGQPRLAQIGAGEPATFHHRVGEIGLHRDRAGQSWRAPRLAELSMAAGSSEGPTSCCIRRRFP